MSEQFIWPEFSKDTQRIRAYSARYKNMDIASAFSDVYGFKVNPVKSYTDTPPKDLRIGDIIDVNIKRIEKNFVEFEGTNSTKSHLISAVNLYKYKRFKTNLPLEPVKAMVTRITRDGVVIDPLICMTHEFILPLIKDPWKQKVVNDPKTIRVKNLKLTRGGFIGQAVIPTTSEFVGEDYTIEAFIPGSQIVLNIANNFEDFVGQDIDAYVVNYIPKPGFDNKMSLICSRKDYLKSVGEMNSIYYFKVWTENGDEWKQIQETTMDGVVTGVINTAKKRGVFIEIPDICITGMVDVPADELVNYKPNDTIKVRITGFEENTYFNQDVQQLQHIEPYIIEDGCIKSCDLKIVLQLA